jgi:hypothetical protein
VRRLGSRTCAQLPTGAVDPARVAAVIDRIVGVDELARARRAGDLDTVAVLSDRRTQRCRWLAEPDLEFG